jgi:lipopolysaccharide biosynthesis glycosyltransferase
MTTFAGLPKDWGSSVMTYARLALPNMVGEDQLFYLDADIIVQAPWASLWNAGCGDATIAAAPDVITQTLGNDHLDLEKFGLDPAAPYFQAGLLLINLEKWREQLVSEKVLDYLRENPGHCRFWDQSALNVVLYRQWRQLPPSWNTPAWWADQRKNGVNLEVPALHFVGPHKPWIYGHHRSPTARIFFGWLDQTSWKRWRPTGVRQARKWAKYRLWKLASDARIWAGRRA